jgi:DNA modification methylase
VSLLLTQGNALQIPLADESVHCVVTSPPYWGLRDYGISDQLGLEPTPEQYVANMVAVFREVRRVLRADGTVWLNLGDSYATRLEGHGGFGEWQTGGNPKPPAGTISTRKRERGNLKPKDLCGIPWRVAFALQADGWWLRSDIIWSKPNPMPESVTDRPTKAHEYLFLLTKSARYYYDADAVREDSLDLHGGGQPRYSIKTTKAYKAGTNEFIDYERGSGRNRRTVWHIATAPYSGAHFATYPPALVEPCIKAGTSERGVCPECGKPWERVVEKSKPPDEVFTNTAQPSDNYVSGGSWRGGGKGSGQKLTKWMSENPTTTLGWQRTCECGTMEPPQPATILDPFAGSGTTLQVARALGRNGVGLDLSLEYLHLARQRLSLDALDKWAEGVAREHGENGSHKNKNIPGQKVNTMHAKRNEKGVASLPLFEGLQ